MSLKSSGFTLVELIVVILILGILSAVAVPKFANLQGSARQASLNGLRAAVSSASTLANALQQAQNLNAGSSVTIEGATVTMSNSYPTADGAGINNAVRFDTSLFSTAGGSPLTFQISAGGCSFTYAAAAATTTPPVISTVSTCS